MAGYDDSKAIEAIYAMLREDPRLSRRAAIIAVAGENSLRRIEIKMQRIEGDDPHAVDTARRFAVAARHAGRHPAATHRWGDAFVFHVVLPGEVVVGAALGLSGDRMLCGVIQHPERREDADYQLNRLSLGYYSDDVLAAVLEEFDITDQGTPGAPSEPGTKLARELAASLVEAWVAEGLGSHLGEDGLLDAAIGMERVRLSAAGLDQLVDALPPGFRQAMSRHIPHAAAKGILQKSVRARVGWLLEKRDRANALQELGGLAPLADTFGHRSDPTEHGTASEFVFALLRESSLGWDKRPTPEDASWLLERFGPGQDGALVSLRSARRLLRNREIVDAFVCRSAVDRAALAVMLSLTDTERYMSGVQDRLFRVLGLLGPVHGRASLVRDAVWRSAEERGVPFADALEEVAVETLEMVSSVWREVACEAGGRIRVGLSAAEATEPSLFLALPADGNSVDGAVEVRSLAMGLVGWEGGAPAIVASVRAWVSAGRPGYAPSPSGRDGDGMDAWAFAEIVNEPSHLPGTGSVAIDHLLALPGANRTRDVLDAAIVGCSDRHIERRVALARARRPGSHADGGRDEIDDLTVHAPLWIRVMRLPMRIPFLRAA